MFGNNSLSLVHFKQNTVGLVLQLYSVSASHLFLAMVIV